MSMNSEARRQDWISALKELRVNDVVDAREHEDLTRMYDEHRRRLEEDMARIVPEYKKRVAEDGEVAANEWLAKQARELGERDGRTARQTMDGLQVVKDHPVQPDDAPL